MKMVIGFSSEAWDIYANIGETDEKLFDAINVIIDRVIAEIDEGIIGKTDGYIIEEINAENDLAYFVDEKGVMRILSCRGHYDD